MENHEVAAIFHEMAAILEIKGENPFRIRAFRRVAQAVETLPERAATMSEAGTLAKVPGVGKGSLSRIREILETGDCEDHAELRASIPDGLLELTRVTGLGPKTIALVYKELGISSVDELEAAALGGHIAPLPRMGDKSQAKLLKAIESYRQHSGRVRIGDALPQGTALLEALEQHAAVQRIDLAGSSRRRRDTIGDLDLLVASEDVEAVMDCFVAQPSVSDVMLRGDTKCSVHLKSGLQVDLRVVLPGSFGAALHYFTGSKMHRRRVIRSGGRPRRRSSPRWGCRISRPSCARTPGRSRPPRRVSCPRSWSSRTCAATCTCTPTQLTARPRPARWPRPPRRWATSTSRSPTTPRR